MRGVTLDVILNEPIYSKDRCERVASRLAELVKRDLAGAIRVNLREELRDTRLVVSQQAGGAEGFELAQFDGAGGVEVDALEDAQERIWRQRHRLVCKELVARQLARCWFRSERR